MSVGVRNRKKGGREEEQERHTQRQGWTPETRRDKGEVETRRECKRQEGETEDERDQKRQMQEAKAKKKAEEGQTRGPDGETEAETGETDRDTGRARIQQSETPVTEPCGEGRYRENGAETGRTGKE